MSNYSSILACKIPWTEKTGGLQFLVSQRAGRDRMHAHTHTHTHISILKFDQGRSSFMMPKMSTVLVVERIPKEKDTKL